jgi:mono/diheme cytochrome c family protein
MTALPRRIHPRRLLLAGVWLAMALSSSAATVDFDRDIQPILSENCYQCHGPDAGARKAKLRLDRKEGALGKNEDGRAIVSPGKPGESELITRILSTDSDEVMPTPKSNKKLTAAQKQLLTRWVEQGAPWAQHWAFVPPKRPPLPEMADYQARLADLEKTDPAQATKLREQSAAWSKWPKNPIDQFVLARLLGEGHTPSPEAAPEKLCRRLYLDLTGIPPTPQEVDAFLELEIRNPQSAIGDLVDHLLASPRYGERMVWEWLDAARYADTNGYQGDPTRAMWYWRDWVIKALNENMPFDQFTIEQIAGDLLPEPGGAEHKEPPPQPPPWIPESRHDQLIATGFHRNHMINGEGGRIAEESRVDYVQDRVETTGAVWLGLTLTCCRCHDHKFDPIRQREYYQFSAYFNSIDETGANDAGGLANPIISFPSPEQQTKIDELKAKEAAAAKDYAKLEKQLRDGQSGWEQSMLAGGEKIAEPVWHLLTPRELSSDHGTQITLQPDGSVLAGGASPDQDDYLFIADAAIGDLTGFKLEAVPDDAFKNRGPGRAPDMGNFVLTEIELQGSGKPVDLGVVSADFSQAGFDAKGAADGSQKTGWAIMPEFGKPHALILEARNKVGYSSSVQLSFRLSFRYGRQHTLGRFKLYATTDNPALFRPAPDRIREILEKAAESRTPPEKEELTKYYLDTSAQLSAAREQRDKAKKTRETAEKQLPRTMVMRERATPRETFILVKGAYDKYAEKVDYGTPEALPAMAPDAPRNRLGLAQWLVSPGNPLTARVVVNRYWQMFFGRGIVKTTEDFGVQGDKPTHPELLDWLAREFVESGWDVKHLQRLIVTSATYRQQSNFPPGMEERDPENKLLARGPRFRLPSWMLRDQALAVSGLLVDKIGGPPVKIYQPANVWEDATFGQIKFTQDHGEALYRRSLYVFWRRIVGPTLFFDVANRQQCAVKVGRTNTPLHALITLNDVTYVEAARALGERMLKEGGATDAERLAYGFRLCTARPPGAKEAALLARSLVRFREQYSAAPEAARQLIAIGESKPDANLPAPELAAHTSVGLLLLNLDETLTKE